MTHVGRKITLLATLTIIVCLLFLAFPSSGLALPQYTTATGQPCTTCHVNATGVGGLTAVGQAFAAIPTHTTDPAGAFAQVSRPAAATATPAPPPAAIPAAVTPTKPAAAVPAATTPVPTAAATATTLPRTGEPAPWLLIALLSGLTLLAGLTLRRAANPHR